MTGTSLHDLASTIAGYETWESAAKPNGAANVINKAHWTYLRRSDFESENLDGGGVWPFGLPCPFAVPFATPFDLVLGYASEGESPRICERVCPGCRLSRR